MRIPHIICVFFKMIIYLFYSIGVLANNMKLARIHLVNIGKQKEHNIWSHSSWPVSILTTLSIDDIFNNPAFKFPAQRGRYPRTPARLASGGSGLTINQRQYHTCGLWRPGTANTIILIIQQNAKCRHARYYHKS